MEGRIKFYSGFKSYGFIELSDECGGVFAELFFHTSDLAGPVAKGDLCEFWIGDDPQRDAWRAVEVRRKQQEGDQHQFLR